MTKVTYNGHEYDWDAVVNLMDDGLREEIHSIPVDNDQEFLHVYAAAHKARFGEEFTIN